MAAAKSLDGLCRAGDFYYNGGRLHPRQIERLKELAPYFSEALQRDVLVPVATQTFDVSLRVLDYTCTNYAKKTRVLTTGSPPVHVFSLYKDWLRHYRRKTFDPFRRRERIYFRSPCDGTVLDTTVAQLNFLRWALTYDILAYVRRHAAVIERDMLATLGESKRRRQAMEAQGLKRRRAELSRAPTMRCIVYSVAQHVTFE